MSENREQILESIKVQGEVVRKLKAAKEPKAKVCFEPLNIDFLNELWSDRNQQTVAWAV